MGLCPHKQEMDPIRVAIVGSRSIDDYSWMEVVLEERFPDVRAVQHVVSGGGAGVDTNGVKWARKRNIKIIELLPDWKKHGKAAGMIRNTDIVKDSDVVLAFWDGKSKGTLDSIKKAKQFGKLVEVYKYRLV